MKRFLYILIPLLVIAAAIFVGYIFKYNGGSTTDTNQPASGGKLPSTQTQVVKLPSADTNTQSSTAALGTQNQALPIPALGLIAENQVTDYFVDSQNDAVLVQPDGQIIKVTNGQSSALSSSIIEKLIHASFSYDGKRVLVSFGDPLNPQSSIFDITLKTWQPLPSGFISATWAPHDYEIAYFTNKSGVVALTTLDTKQTKPLPKEIARLHVQDVSLQWTSPSVILIRERGSAFTPAAEWAYDLKKRAFSSLIDGVFGMQSMWGVGPATSSHKGLLLRGTVNRRGGSLEFVDTNGTMILQFAFLTLPSKCLFRDIVTTSTPPVSTSTKVAPLQAPVQSTLLYCAVPQDPKIFSSVALPDAYNKKVIFTADNLYAISLTDGSVQAVLTDPPQDIDATDLKIENGRLFFVNRYDNRLYAATLPK